MGPLIAARQGHGAVSISVAIGTLVNPTCYRHSRREDVQTPSSREDPDVSFPVLQTHAGFGRPQVSPVPSSPAKSPPPSCDKQVA